MKTIEIKDYQKGVAQSPFTGYGAIRSLDIWGRQGIAKKEKRPTVKSDSATPVLTDDIFGLRYFVSTADLVRYMADDDNVIEVGNDYTNITSEEVFVPKGLIIWKDYLISFPDRFSCYGPLSGTPAWNDIDFTGSVSRRVKPLHFLDDSLYVFCLEGGGLPPRLIRLSEDTTFNPTDSATYTKTENVLSLPSGYTIRTLVQFGGRIMIGAEDPIGSAVIFPWDGYSSSFFSPIYLNERGLYSIEVSGGSMYILAGRKGNWYVSNGTQTQLYREMPDIWEKTNYNPNIEYNCTSLKDNIIYFGIDNAWADYSQSPFHYQTEEASGVWGLNLETGALTQVYSARSIIEGVSSYEITDIADLHITGLLNGVENIGISYMDNTDFNWNVRLFRGRSDSNFVDNETVYIETPFYQLGRVFDKQYPYLQFYLANPLATGENIKVYYREATDDDWTLHETLTGTNLQTKKIAEIINIQFKIVLNTDSELTNILLNYGK